MADSGQTRELVFCHRCENEWHRDEHGLHCPQCHSDFVEVIEDGHDPRDTHDDDPEEISPDSLPHDPLHNHNPWEQEAPDPDEGDIEHVEWNAGPGLHFTRTSFRSSSPGMRQGGPGVNDPITPIFQTFATMVEQGTRRHQQVSGGHHHFHYHLHPQAFPNIPRHPFMDMFGRSHDHHYPHTYTHTNPSRLQEGLPRMGGRTTVTGTARLLPRDANNAQPQAIPVDQLHGILTSLMQNMHGMHTDGGGGPPGPGSPFHIIAQLLNPAHAAHGDAVYTEEALDRVISQFMDAQNGSTAPGPASAAAIAALPKKEANKNMMGSDGKAECSVCMDNVDIGDEVTVLPCSHWFHGECVGAWLKEHDTCPHCRQGIMPRDPSSSESRADQPRSPGQAPRNSQNPLSPGANENLRFQWHPGMAPSLSRSSPSQGSSGRPDTGRRRSSGRSGGDGGSSGSGSGSSGGFSGWVRNHFGSGGGSERGGS